MKKLNKFAVAQIKRTAQNSYAILRKMQKIEETINQLQEEHNSLVATYELYQAPIKHLTGGFSTDELVNRVVTDTGKLDKNGNAIKTAQWVLKYPETILPESTEVVESLQAEEEILPEQDNMHQETFDL